MPAIRSKKLDSIWGKKNLEFRCTGCGNCCTETIVPITHEDLKRLEAGTGLSAEELVDFHKPDDFEDGGEGLHVVELNVGKRIMGLRKRTDRKTKKSACQFLRDNRCTVYAHRPVTCRLWPFTLGFWDDGEIRSLTINRSVDCEYALDGQVDLDKVKRDWDRDDRQDLRWRRKVEHWNKQIAPGTRRQFLDYLARS